MKVEPPQWQWWWEYAWLSDNGAQVQGHIGSLTPLPEGTPIPPARPIGFRMAVSFLAQKRECPLCGCRHDA